MALLMLNCQTNTVEESYLPNDNVLVDAYIDDPALDNLSNIVLTAVLAAMRNQPLKM